MKTNEEKYKTPAERSAAFDRFCDERIFRCQACDCTACHFRWLKLATEKPPKIKIITNADYYQSIRARKKAFNEFCSLRRCQTCDLGKMNGNCRFHWLDLVHSIEKKDSSK